MARTTAYREAGADCLYVPGIADAETIGRLVKEVGAPVNVVKGLAGIPMSVNQLEDLGVKRVSIGGSLVRATLGFIHRAPAEIRDYGTFGYAATAGAGFRPLTVLRRPPGYNGSVTDLRAMYCMAWCSRPHRVSEFWTVVRTDDHDCPPYPQICNVNNERGRDTLGVPNGIRTRVATLKGWCPRPG